jgi:hypothetical protein
VRLSDLTSVLSPLVTQPLAADLVRDFLKVRQDHATGTLERASSGKFVETVVQCLQQIAEGSHQSKPDVDSYLRTVESNTKLDEGMRICAARIARAIYTLRNKRNVAHKSQTLDPSLTDLAFAHHAANWIMCEFLRLTTGVSMDEAAALIALVQAPINTLVEDMGGVPVVLAPKISIRTELLILLHSRYPEVLQQAEILESLSRRTAASVTRELRKLHDEKLAHGNQQNGYKLTQVGHRASVGQINSLQL